MISLNHIAEFFGPLLGLLFYGWLFTSTIIYNRKERGVVLGVATVTLFAGLLFYFQLLSKHQPEWIRAAVEIITLLAGLSIISLIALDVPRWAFREQKSDTSEKGPAPQILSGAR